MDFGGVRDIFKNGIVPVKTFEVLETSGFVTSAAYEGSGWESFELNSMIEQRFESKETFAKLSPSVARAAFLVSHTFRR